MELWQIIGYILLAGLSVVVIGGTVETTLQFWNTTPEYEEETEED